MLVFILSTLIILSQFSFVKSLGRLRDAPVQDGLCDASVKSYSGYFEVSSGVDKNYFFWLFESRDTPATDPLILWLTGGPGIFEYISYIDYILKIATNDYFNKVAHRNSHYSLKTDPVRLLQMASALKITLSRGIVRPI